MLWLRAKGHLSTERRAGRAIDSDHDARVGSSESCPRISWRLSGLMNDTLRFVDLLVRQTAEIIEYSGSLPVILRMDDNGKV